MMKQLLAGSCMALALSLSACEKPADPHAGHDHGEHDGHDHAGHDHGDHDGHSHGDVSEESNVYTVRGQVMELPDDEDPRKQFVVHHEAIHEFVNREGKVSGMNAMSMPFHVPEDRAMFDTLAVGDIIEFTWSVNYSRRPAGVTSDIKKLPADTQLTFGPATPPTGEQGEGSSDEGG